MMLTMSLKVVTYNKELIESAVNVSALEKDLKPLSEAVRKLREHIAQLSSQLKEPYNVLEVFSLYYFHL